MFSLRPPSQPSVRRDLVIVLGDQLDLDAAAFDGFDPAVDAVWMAEVAQESTHVWSSQPRIALFLAAMRHFAMALQAADRPLHYTRLEQAGNCGSIDAQLQADIERLRPDRLVMTAPGDWRLLQAIKSVAQNCGLDLDIRDDRHFFTTVRDFRAHAKGRKSLRMEYFYREQRNAMTYLCKMASPWAGNGISMRTTARLFLPLDRLSYHLALCSNRTPSRAK